MSPAQVQMKEEDRGAESRKKGNGSAVGADLLHLPPRAHRLHLHRRLRRPIQQAVGVAPAAAAAIVAAAAVVVLGASLESIQKKEKRTNN